MLLENSKVFSFVRSIVCLFNNSQLQTKKLKLLSMISIVSLNVVSYLVLFVMFVSPKSMMVLPTAQAMVCFVLFFFCCCSIALLFM